MAGASTAETRNPNGPIERHLPLYATNRAQIGEAMAVALNQSGLASVTFSYGHANIPPLPEGLDLKVAQDVLAHPLSVSVTVIANNQADYETLFNAIHYVADKLMSSGMLVDFPRDASEDARIDVRRAELVAIAVGRIQVLKDQGKMAPFDPRMTISEKEEIAAQIASLERTANDFRWQVYDAREEMAPIEQRLRRAELELDSVKREIARLREKQAGLS